MQNNKLPRLRVSSTSCLRIQWGVFLSLAKEVFGFYFALYKGSKTIFLFVWNKGAGNRIKVRGHVWEQYAGYLLHVIAVVNACQVGIDRVLMAEHPKRRRGASGNRSSKYKKKKIKASSY